MSQFVTVTNAVNSWVRFTFPSAGACRFQYDIRTTDTSGGTIVSLVGNNNHWRGSWVGGSSSTTIRIIHLKVDGNAIGATTSGGLSNAIATGNWMTLRYDRYANSSDDNFVTPFSINDVIEFANYSLDASFCPNADLRNFKVDLGITGSWTHESTLGDTNGFTRNNVTVSQINTSFQMGMPI